MFQVDAIISSVADRLQIPKAAVLDPTASDAAVKQAHAETFIIQETKKYFASHGVDLEAFSKSERGDTAILVKNLPNGTKTSEIRSLFQEYGELSRVLTPPAGMIAIVEFGQANQARAAFGNLAYRRFKDSILYLEKAPKGLFINIDRSSQEVGGSVCKPLDGFLYALVKTKPDPKRPGQVLSMGFGFLEFRSKGQAHSAASALNDHDLDGHQLLVRAAHRSLDAGEATREEDKERKATGKKTKIIIKNLPFEVTKKDVRALFGAYGQLRSVRLPKKFDHSARGFAFAEFVTAREAESAIAALKHTHLLGRRLVLEFAADDTIDAEEELQRMQNKIGRQADKVALQRLIGTDRQKFAVEGDGN
ncbi:MAG: Multiple RNA-binding domain-containing protein 1 [Phylliscum demangeonii]|nr:MAG: Multiple RNA-binding domain-containing protein 1 [Phylliscum demangeonii]